MNWLTFPIMVLLETGETVSSLETLPNDISPIVLYRISSLLWFYSIVVEKHACSGLEGNTMFFYVLLILFFIIFKNHAA